MPDIKILTNSFLTLSEKIPASVSVVSVNENY